MQDTMLSILPSFFVLGLAAVVALRLMTTRWSPLAKVAERIDVSRALAVATGIQGVHFCEEALTGFHEQLGAVLGFPAMSFTFFLVFNLAWLIIWLFSIIGVRSRYPGAYFAAWFLSIAGIANGVAHPILAIVAGGYFPGLITSPAIFLAAVYLWRRLYDATEERRATAAK